MEKLLNGSECWLLSKVTHVDLQYPRRSSKPPGTPILGAPCPLLASPGLLWHCVHVWMSEDNVWELVHSFLCLGIDLRFYQIRIGTSCLSSPPPHRVIFLARSLVLNTQCVQSIRPHSATEYCLEQLALSGCML